MPIKKLTRVIQITYVALLLSACPATYYGYIKNESSNEIAISPPNTTSSRITISNNELGKTLWHQECITIIDGDSILYFEGWPIPKSVPDIGVFSVSLNAMYKDGKLYFINENDKKIEVPHTSDCS